MHPRMLLAIFRKDMRDAIRNAHILIAILVPLGMGVIYGIAFDDDEALPELEVAYASADETELFDILREDTEGVARLSVRQMATADQVRDEVDEEDVDIGLILPPGFDEAITQGESPEIEVVLPADPNFTANFVLAALRPVTEQMAGISPPVNLNVDMLTEPGDAASVVEALGPRIYFVQVSMIFLIGMISMLVVPVLITEETEKGTLGALVMIASYPDVIVAKALVGIAYIALAGPLMLVMTGVTPEDPALFAAGIGLLALALVGFGLLIGGLFRNMNQLNTWGGVFILVAVAPAFTVGFPLPDAVATALDVTPTAHAMKIATNGMGGETHYSGMWLSVAVLLAWAAAAYTILLYRMRTREV